MLLLGVGGEPATGKTTLFRRFIDRTGGRAAWRWRKRGLVVYHRNDKLKAIILGDYKEQGAFGGTDRLSMAVQKKVVKFLKGLCGGEVEFVLFEGDRLWNNSFFTALEEHSIPFKLIELTAAQGLLNQRHRERQDGQSNKWLEGRRTKLRNLRRRWKVDKRLNESLKDLRANCELLLAAMKEGGSTEGKAGDSSLPLSMDRTTAPGVRPPKVDGSAPPASHVRMIQLFLDTTTLPLLEKYLKVLVKKYHTKTVTETILECLRRSAEAKKEGR